MVRNKKCASKGGQAGAAVCGRAACDDRAGPLHAGDSAGHLRGGGGPQGDSEDPLGMETNMYVCMYACMYVCMSFGFTSQPSQRLRKSLGVQTSMYVCMYVLMYACMHACMYVSDPSRELTARTRGIARRAAATELVERTRSRLISEHRRRTSRCSCIP